MSAIVSLVSLSGIADRILGLPPSLVLALVFLLPALEASAFLGFIFPGEVAVILGGVAASQETVPLAAAMGAAISGAIIGDSLGYLVGRRWGTELLHGTIGRLPIIRRHLDKHLEGARAYVRRRKGSAVFFGRFTAALRVLVPGLAGISDVHYPTFLAYNVAGGVLWGGGFTVLGYVAGANYQQAEHIAGRIGFLLLGLIVLGLLAARLLRRVGERSTRLRRLGDRLATILPLPWILKRFPRQVRWLRGRLTLEDPRGFWLTFALAACGFAAWAFGGLTQDVVAHDDTALLDPHVMSWLVAHRVGWVTTTMEVSTWLGSTAIILPALAVITVLLLRTRRYRRPVIGLLTSVGGAIGLYDVVKPVVGRARPPSALWIGHYSGYAFPSGHATQSMVFYGMLAIVLSAGRSLRTRAVLWTGASLLVVIVGASRLYLGANWLTDVLGGWALGAAWVALVVAMGLAVTPPTDEKVASPQPHEPTLSRFVRLISRCARGTTAA